MVYLVDLCQRVSSRRNNEWDSANFPPPPPMSADIGKAFRWKVIGCPVSSLEGYLIAQFIFIVPEGSTARLSLKKRDTFALCNFTSTIKIMC